MNRLVQNIRLEVHSSFYLSLLLSRFTSLIVRFEIGITFSESNVSNSNLDNSDSCAAFPIVSFCRLYNLIAKEILICCFNSVSDSFNATRISEGNSIVIDWVFRMSVFLSKIRKITTLLFISQRFYLRENPNLNIGF